MPGAQRGSLLTLCVRQMELCQTLACLADCATPWLQFIDRLWQQQPHEKCWKTLMTRAKRRQAELEDPKVLQARLWRRSIPAYR